jgi:hypothetical protein
MLTPQAKSQQQAQGTCWHHRPHRPANKQAAKRNLGHMADASGMHSYSKTRSHDVLNTSQAKLHRAKRPIPSLSSHLEINCH